MTQVVLKLISPPFVTTFHATGARSEAWFAYRREEDSNPRLHMVGYVLIVQKCTYVPGLESSHLSPSTTSIPAVELFFILKVYIPISIQK